MDERKVNSTVAGMASWWKAFRWTKDDRSRPPVVRGWDSGVLAASELIRRLTNYDEELAGAVHSLLSTKLPAAPVEGKENGA